MGVVVGSVIWAVLESTLIFLSELALFLCERCLFISVLWMAHLNSILCSCYISRFTLNARVINVKLPLQPHQKYYITQHEELSFSSLTQRKDDYAANSHYITYTFFFKMLGESTF